MPQQVHQHYASRGRKVISLCKSSEAESSKPNKTCQWMDLLLCRGGSSLTKKVGIDIYLNKEVLYKVWTKHIVLFEGLVNV